MNTAKFIGLGATALKSNFTNLGRPYKLTFSITYWCQSRCITCVQPDEIILGDNKPIIDLKIGDQAAGANGLNEISQTFSRSYSGEMIKIKALGLLPVKATPEHPLLIAESKTKRHHSRLATNKYEYYRTYEFKEPTWKEAKDVKPKTSFVDGDYLCVPVIKRALDIKELNLASFTRNRGEAISRGKGHSLIFKLDEDTAWLLGIYTAEGCPASNGARFSFNIKETHLHEKVKQIARKLGYSVTKTTSKIYNIHCTQCNLNSIIISRAFKDWCGTGALNKKIPDFVLFNKDDSVLKAFLKGWEDGDGYWKGDVFYGSTVSKTLALQLQLAYASLGIFSRITHVHKERGKFYDHEVNYHDVYMITYSRNPNIRYAKRLGNYFLHPIRKIEKIQYTGTVHNIETSDNTYLVSNAIVHNCNIWEIRPKGELSLQEIQEFAKKNDYFKWIEITGGEPFLRSDIVEIVKAFKENSKDLYILTMPTNSLCNPEMELRKIEEILKLGIPKVSITLSLDGHRELHDKIRGVKGNFDKVIDMARKLRELQVIYKNLFFIFGYTMSKFNQGELQKTYEGVKQELPWVTYNNFHVNVGQISDSYYKNANLDIKAQQDMIANDVKTLIKNKHFEMGAIPLVENVFLRNLVKYIETGNSPMKSKSLDASLFLDSYGNVYPSIMWGRKIGNIKESNYDLMPIWKNSEADEVRKLIREGKEPNAWTACEAYQSIVGNISSLISTR
ncbi:MAG: radical SAM protein [Candidatus Micrarchaeota archaeon]|nr:radical SAM protein [Candidatus Micrarchaeota archaeon]MDE1849379.1 radical SAM protein [Candidatus Micrarchaeota archaeon]